MWPMLFLCAQHSEGPILMSLFQNGIKSKLLSRSFFLQHHNIHVKTIVGCIAKSQEKKTST